MHKVGRDGERKGRRGRGERERVYFFFFTLYVSHFFGDQVTPLLNFVTLSIFGMLKENNKSR